MLNVNKQLNIIFRSISILFALLISSAYAENKQILCPPTDLVKNSWQHLDSVQILDGKAFRVYSNMDSVFDEQSQLWWQIESSVIASDLNTAYTMGQSNVKDIVSSQEKNARCVNEYSITGSSESYPSVANQACLCDYVDSTGISRVSVQVNMPNN